MDFWALFQILMFVTLFAAFAAVWVRLGRPQKDDPRLSKGLQLLQSKIAILEDLSDRTEVQSKQLLGLMEAKVKEITSKIQQADRQVQKIQVSMEKSMEVAKIFEDKIPHEEIIERETQIKYVRAARMAHSGHSVDEIATELDLPRSEVELICKVNKDQLVYKEDELPEWLRTRIEQGEGEAQFVEEEEAGPHLERDMTPYFEVPNQDREALKRLGEEFRKACEGHSEEVESEPVSVGVSSDRKAAADDVEVKQATSPEKSPMRPSPQRSQEKAGPTRAGTPLVELPEAVRLAEFRKVDLVKDLE